MKLKNINAEKFVKHKLEVNVCWFRTSSSGVSSASEGERGFYNSSLVQECCKLQ